MCHSHLVLSTELLQGADLFLKPEHPLLRKHPKPKRVWVCGLSELLAVPYTLNSGMKVWFGSMRLMQPLHKIPGRQISLCKAPRSHGNRAHDEKSHKET